jgi:hypothetical protein
MGKFTVDDPVWIHDEGEEPETDRESDSQYDKNQFLKDAHKEDIDAGTSDYSSFQELGEYDQIDINKLDLSNKEERILFFGIKNHGRDSFVVDGIIEDYKNFEKKCPVCLCHDSSNLEWCDNCEHYRMRDKETFIDLLEDTYSVYVKRVKHIYSSLAGDKLYERKPKTIEL